MFSLINRVFVNFGPMTTQVRAIIIGVFSQTRLCQFRVDELPPVQFDGRTGSDYVVEIRQQSLNGWPPVEIADLTSGPTFPHLPVPLKKWLSYESRSAIRRRFDEQIATYGILIGGFGKGLLSSISPARSPSKVLQDSLVCFQLLRESRAVPNRTKADTLAPQTASLETRSLNPKYFAPPKKIKLTESMWSSPPQSGARVKQISCCTHQHETSSQNRAGKRSLGRLV